jgi:predicted transglutaminase-like cysteine proteinase
VAAAAQATPASAIPENRPAPQKASPIKFGLFGSIEFRAGRLDALAQWRNVRARIARERSSYGACEAGKKDCPARIDRWRAELSRLEGKDRLTQLRRVNRYVNRAIAYRTDAARFARKDYWASPGQVLGRSGDCEDYAIAKFVSLIDLGFSNSQLRIVVVRDTIRRIDHAVVAATLGGRTYVLDNLFDEPVPHQYVLQYNPVYSVNLDTRWAHVVTPQIRSAFVSQLVNGHAAEEPAGRDPVDVVELTE